LEAAVGWLQHKVNADHTSRMPLFTLLHFALCFVMSCNAL
jgi:hypothetical protein